ncbi:hypothetical protein AWC38_SpisGene20920 [Stylophora pistillata]|uniref:Uncharacterized protein n=1 Tax=Stylophora pistillata TaxID=50429 RepID=A0A2B4REI4_STYPI|nr:hypothetical protein AWC38_SpisGene20920 [Stylophora pistillata]
MGREILLVIVILLVVATVNCHGAPLEDSNALKKNSLLEKLAIHTTTAAIIDHASTAKEKGEKGRRTMDVAQTPTRQGGLLGGGEVGAGPQTRNRRRRVDITGPQSTKVSRQET